MNYAKGIYKLTHQVQTPKTACQDSHIKYTMTSDDLKLGGWDGGMQVENIPLGYLRRRVFQAAARRGSLEDHCALLIKSAAVCVRSRVIAADGLRRIDCILQIFSR
ncbi:hypothetical protein AVEN_214930-1 [Araneus ventricosus]|uniref:Uncharacterized protein n=1 Tax=Araneus ventricosus TaxID=182803 RepID=A0A4Y2DB07_ARAVE|nr:hypothetical protein AVEN_214930-1 [Araneus ventricosus]